MVLHWVLPPYLSMKSMTFWEMKILQICKSHYMHCLIISKHHLSLYLIQEHNQIIYAWRTCHSQLVSMLNSQKNDTTCFHLWYKSCRLKYRMDYSCSFNYLSLPIQDCSNVIGNSNHSNDHCTYVDLLDFIFFLFYFLLDRIFLIGGSLE